MVKDIKQICLKIKNYNQKYKIRSLIVLKGDEDWCKQQFSDIKSLYNDWLWVGSSGQPFAINSITDLQLKSCLGQEYNAAVYSGFTDLNADSIGILSGTIKAGGVLILLLPQQRIEDNSFRTWFNLKIKADKNTICFSQNKKSIIPPLESREEKSLVIAPPYKTCDQKLAVEAILKVALGHSNRPLILTADRGRGKTTALGIAIEQLLDEYQRKNRVLQVKITAPRMNNVKACFAYLEQQKLGSMVEKNLWCSTVTDSKGRSLIQLQFLSPDKIVSISSGCSLLFVDEAAAIPINMLEEILKHSSRVVFSSTVHGYEGSGRGFTLKFSKILNTLKPQNKKIHLKIPIRWASNDPLENFIFNSLLLNVEIKNLNKERDFSLNNLEIRLVTQVELLANHELLKDIFAILVNAHYQTRPADLVLLLNSSLVSIITVFFKEQVVGCALLITEGDIESALIAKINCGKKRVKGNLIAQGLIAQTGIELAGKLDSYRIMRIAIHPSLQNMSIGSSLLNWIIGFAKREKKDFLSTSYGVSENLLNFWKNNKFLPVSFAMRKDAASGLHSIQMILPLSIDADFLYKELSNSLRLNLPLQVLTNNLVLSPGIILAVSDTLIFKKPESLVVNQIATFTNGGVGLDYILGSLNIWLWFIISNNNLNINKLSCEIEDLLFLIDIIINNNIDKYISKLGKKQVYKKLRIILGDILCS